MLQKSWSAKGEGALSIVKSVMQCMRCGGIITDPKFFLRRIRGLELLPLFLDFVFGVDKVPDDESGKRDVDQMEGGRRLIGEKVVHLLSRHFWRNSSWTRLKITTLKRENSSSDLMSLE